MATESPTNDAMKGPWITGWFSRLTSRGDGARPTRTRGRVRRSGRGGGRPSVLGGLAQERRVSRRHADAANGETPHPRAGAPRPGLPSPPPPPGVLAIRPPISPSPTPSSLFSLFLSRRADVGISPVTLQDRFTSPVSSTSDEPGPYYAETTCFGTLGRENPPRRACIPSAGSVVRNLHPARHLVQRGRALSDAALQDGRARVLRTPAASTYGPGNSAIDDSELFFTVVFTIEMLVKMIASGVFFEREAYLKDGWNVMDFVVVVVSLVSLVPGMGSNVSALRVIRVLRPPEHSPCFRDAYPHRHDDPLHSDDRQRPPLLHLFLHRLRHPRTSGVPRRAA